ncbi:MAG: O-antigen ligase family protein [Rhodopirellula sp.]|nr:O-antigen ligase family protein [Rhodopirellula sp.]
MPRDRRPSRDRPPRPAASSANAPWSERLRPWLLGAMCALLVARPLFPSEGAPESGDSLPVVMLWIGITAVWFLGATGSNPLRFRFGWTDAAVLLLVAWCVISGIGAVMYGSPRAAINVMWDWIGVGLALVMARQLMASRREARAVIAVMIALAVALAVFGLYQYFYEMSKTGAEYGRDPDAKLREIGMWAPAGSPERRAFELRLGAMEPIATFALTNSLAGLLVVWLTMAVGIAASAGLKRPGLRTLLTTVVAALAMAACLVLTKSRSGYLAAVVGLLPAWWVGHGGRQRFGWRSAAVVVAVCAAMVAVVGLGVGVGAVDYEVLAEASKSLGYRLQYWQASLAMIADHPLFGCGPGQFQQAYTVYKLPAASEEIADPHNFLLEIWATAGTPAALALVVALTLFTLATVRGRESFLPVGRKKSRVERQESRAKPEEEKTLDPLGPADPLLNGDCLPQTAPTDATMYVLVGGALGYFLSLPLGLMSSGSPGWIGIAIGLPVSLVLLAALRPWIYQGRLPLGLPAVAVFSLLVNLAAAGGIGFAGVAGSLWLLLALGLTLVEPQRGFRLPRSGAWTGLVATMIAAVACYHSAYRPVLQSRTAMEIAQREPDRAATLLAEAASADPLAAEPRAQQAILAFARWQRTRSEEALGEFETHQAAALRRDPRSNSAWAQAGRLCFDAHRLTGDPRLGEKAVEAYRHAVDYYPTNANYRGELALAYLAVGNEPAFRENSAKAFDLDRITPHEDKKLKPVLADELRKHLPRMSSGAN